MRRILPLAITFAALSLSTAGGHADGTWCAHYGTGLEGMSNAALPSRGSVDFAKPIYPRQRSHDGVIGATIKNARRPW
jgi:hypothetical protein